MDEDERWRMVATYRSSDTSPKERFVHQQAGDGGYGGSSYLDLVAFREKDANTAWTTASDGTLEERLYYCQNQHADVVALITAAGTQREMVRYSAYGVPFGLPVGDVDSDGDCDLTDQNQVRDWALAPAYDVRGDLDLDGDVDLTDRNTLRDEFKGVTLGRGVLSAGAVANRYGLAGYVHSVAMPHLLHIRRRAYESELGTWIARDPVGDRNSASLLQFCASDPQDRLDPSGTISVRGKVTANRQYCGMDVGVKFTISLGGGRTADDVCPDGEGVIIYQKVYRALDYHSCWGMAVGHAGQPWWELVIPMIGRETEITIEDSWQTGALPNTFGTVRQSSEFRAYCSGSSQDESDTWGPTERSRDWPATYKEPKFWKATTPEGGAASLSIRADWNCCDWGPGGPTTAGIPVVLAYSADYLLSGDVSYNFPGFDKVLGLNYGVFGQ